MRILFLILCLIHYTIMTMSDQEGEWWKSSTIYEIYPRSFQDSNGDGVGDIKGIISRLDYFNYLGVDAIWLTPVYTSPMKDFGYDVSDYKDIDPIFGNISDIKTLISAAHNKRIKVIMDFVPNHSSLEHPWFDMSWQKIQPYKDYYVWKNGKKDKNDKLGPPNNWLSVFGGSAWTWNTQRKQYYYHAFLNSQPDLNLENPKVVEELKGILKFWLELGVDGFRFDAVAFMHEDQRFLNEPIDDGKKARVVFEDEYEHLKHIYSQGQPKTRATLLELRNFIKGYANEHKQPKLMMVEDYAEPGDLVKYYDESNVDFPFNFGFVEFDRKSLGGWSVYRLVHNWLKYANTPKKMAQLGCKSFFCHGTGNHDRHRLATRFGEHMVDAMHMILFLLPGTLNVYYGDELGLTNTEPPPFAESQDTFAINMGPERYKLHTRDPERSPMQWDSSAMAGFTSSDKPWLPLNPNYTHVNVEVQKNTPFSHLRIFKALLQLRREPAFRGLIIKYGSITHNIFSFARWQDDHGKNGYLIIVNVGRDSETYSYVKHPPNLTPTRMEVILYTGNMNSTSNVSIGKKVDLSDPYKDYRKQQNDQDENSDETNGVEASVNAISRRSLLDPPLHLKPGQGLVLGWGSSLPHLKP